MCMQCNRLLYEYILLYIYCCLRIESITFHKAPIPEPFWKRLQKNEFNYKIQVIVTSKKECVCKKHN